MTCRFNPRTHTGCDLRISRHRPSTVLSFQSTHPHGVRRYVIRRILRRAVVSIHAPTRGATSYIYNRYFAPVVSIHAPTRGATLYLRVSGLIQGGFNPRTHTGCDMAPLRDLLERHGFNPRTHTGCDCISLLILTCKTSFNPRTHTGCD